MKLYATVTSERATKGQGGNKFIEVEIKDDNRETILLLHLTPSEDAHGSIINARIGTADHVYLQYTGENITQREEKDNKQKGKKFTVVNYTNKEERVVFDTLAEAQQFATDTNGEIE